MRGVFFLFLLFFVACQKPAEVELPQEVKRDFSEQALIRRFGTADLQITEGITRHLQYRDDFCVANIFLKNDKRGWQVSYIDVIIYGAVPPFNKEQIEECWTMLSIGNNI